MSEQKLSISMPLEYLWYLVPVAAAVLGFWHGQAIISADTGFFPMGSISMAMGSQFVWFIGIILTHALMLIAFIPSVKKAYRRTTWWLRLIASAAAVIAIYSIGTLMGISSLTFNFTGSLEDITTIVAVLVTIALPFFTIHQTLKAAKAKRQSQVS